MTGTRESLYRAICAGPDEDTLRLVYADLLEEAGEAARAAFIRAQIALVRMPAHDPASVAIRLAYPDAPHGHTMAHTLPRLPAGYSWSAFEFRRGFPWKVAVVSSAAYDPAGAVFAAAPIQALDFGACESPCAESLAAWPHLARIRRLEFTNAGLGRDDIQRLADSPHNSSLTEFGFEFGGITEDGLEALAGSSLFARLTTLDLGSVGCPAALIVDALGAARSPGSLTALTIGSNRFDGIDVAHLLAMPAVRALRRLALADNPQLGLEGAKALSRSGVIRGLEHLDLDATNPGAEGVRVLCESGALSQLRTLSLAGNRLGPTAAKRIVAARSLRKLRVLNLSGNPLGDSGAAALADSPTLGGLVELDLSDTQISDAGALALAESRHLTNLCRLSLTTNDPEGQTLAPDVRAALRERFGSRVVL